MFCGKKYTHIHHSQIKCEQCLKHCMFCGKEIYYKNRDSIGICQDCHWKRMHNFPDEQSFFTGRYNAKRELGPYQRMIADKLKNHFDIVECYRIESFLIDIYFRDLDLYIIFINPALIKKDPDSKFGKDEKKVLKNINEYKDAFFKRFGKEIVYVYSTDLVRMDETDVVNFFMQLKKSHSKTIGEYFL